MSNTDTAAFRDELDAMDRVFLERLRLAADVILQLGEDPGALSPPLESELVLFRERIERVLLKPAETP